MSYDVMGMTLARVLVLRPITYEVLFLQRVFFWGGGGWHY